MSCSTVHGLLSSQLEVLNFDQDNIVRYLLLFTICFYLRMKSQDTDKDNDCKYFKDFYSSHPYNKLLLV